MEAKLIKEISDKRIPWYGHTFVFECIDCGANYTRSRYDARTTPYCCKCQKRHDKERNVKRQKQRKQAEINEVLDKIRAEIEQAYCKVENDYDQGRNYGLYIANQIIDKYKAESEG